MSAIWRQTQPLFQIDRYPLADCNPYRCCQVTGYRVRSMHRLTCEELRGLFKLNLLGSGQEFRINSQCDGKELPAGQYAVPCVDDKTGLPVKMSNGQDYPVHQYNYYEYITSTLCDSSD